MFIFVDTRIPVKTKCNRIFKRFDGFILSACR